MIIEEFAIQLEKGSIIDKEKKVGSVEIQDNQMGD